jgi:nucleoside-diphosphate-sugar epimerase
VTGGAGFLGSVLTDRLQSAGANVFVSRRREFDLTDPTATARLFTQASPSVVFHLAATVGGIGANRANPGRFFYENMVMGLNVLEQARTYGRLAKLIIVVLGSAGAEARFSDTERLAGYALSKLRL